MKKKVLALVLALTMALSLLPVTAMADGGASTTYTATFEANDKTKGTVPDPVTVAAGSKFTIPGRNNLEKDGYYFVGWNDGTATYQAGKKYTMPANPVTFTAQWLRKPSATINSFNVLDNIRTRERTIEIYYTITNRNAEEMTYDIWWRLATDVNDAIVTGKGAIVTLSANETRDEKLSATIPADKADAVIANAKQLRLHVRNEGSGSGSSDLTFFVLKTVQDNIHKGDYVTLYNNGGLYDGAATSPEVFVDVEKNYGSVQWVDTSLYSREGYTFLGFADDPNDTAADYTSDELKALEWETSAKIKEWYAVWTPNQYTVTFNANGGTIATGKDVTSYTYGVGATLPVAADMAKAGYTFGGWYTDSAFGGTAVTAISNTDTGDKTFYAKWEPNTYNVTVDASDDDGGTVFVAPTALYDSAVSVAITSASGYKIDKVQLKYSGTEIDLTNNISSDTSFESSFTMPAADVELAVEFIRLTTDVELPVERKTYYFVEHYVQEWDGSYKPVETEVLNGEIGTTVTADSTKYDDNAHHVNTAKSTLNGVVSFDRTAQNPMETVLTLKVYYDITPYYPSVDPTPVIPSMDVDIHDDTLSDAAKAVGSAVKSGAADITPVAGYTKESIAQMQKDNALKLVVEKKNSYDPAEKALIDTAAQEKGETSLVQFLEIDVTLRTMNDVIVAEVDDTIVDLTITVDLNAEMQKAAKEGKTIYVARAHDGKVTFIEGTLNAEKTQFTFDSSKFSTYALVAFDSQTVVAAKTADAGIFLAVSMSILSVTGSAVLLKKKED